MREERYETEQEEDPVNKLARMIMQHEREQREKTRVGTIGYSALCKKNNATQGLSLIHI